MICLSLHLDEQATRTFDLSRHLMVRQLRPTCAQEKTSDGDRLPEERKTDYHNSWDVAKGAQEGWTIWQVLMELKIWHQRLRG